MGSLLRTFAWLALAGTLVVAAVDSGSVALTRLTVPDDLRDAGRAAAETVRDQPIDRRTAVAAFAVATDAVAPQGITLSPDAFTLAPGGTVRITGTRTAPTLLLDRVTALRHLAVVRESVTVEPLPYR